MKQQDGSAVILQQEHKQNLENVYSMVSSMWPARKVELAIENLENMLELLGVKNEGT